MEETGIADALGTRRTKRIQGDEPCIVGKNGTIHADGKGWSVFVSLKSNKGLNLCKAAFSPFMELRQDGDAEAVFHMPKLPTPVQARIIRRWVGLPKRRVLSEEQLATLVARGAANLSKINHDKHVKNAPGHAQMGQGL